MMKKKSKICIAMAVVLATTMLAGCGETKTKQAQSPKGEEKEVVVFAAASMTETLTEIAELYKKEAPNVKLTFNFDSSGTLKTQIQEGAVCDVFVSAGQKQMDQMDRTASSEKNTEGLDFVVEHTRKDLLENEVVLCVSEGNPANIENFDDLAKKLPLGEVLMAMGNSDVPVGQYTQKILAYYGLNEEELGEKGAITYGTNVKEITTQVVEGSVDCGVIYRTDAYSAGLEDIDKATEEMCGRAIYPAALIKTGKAQKEGEKFLAYLSGAEATKVFEKAGFQIVR